MFDQKYLIITAHPDDLESSCGGLVAKINANGGSVTNLILVKPSAEENKNRDAKKVANELQKSQSILNFIPIVYDTPLHENGRPNLKMSNNLVSYVEKIASKHDVLITHWKEDYHQDHRVCYDVGRSVARKDLRQFWCIDQTPYNLHYKHFSPNLYVDITEYKKTKRLALESYESYFTPSAIETIFDYNKYRGSFLGLNKLAETFKVIYNKT